MKGFAALALLIFVSVYVNGHIRTWEPPGRSTLWRDSRFDSYEPVKNEEDDGIYCGRIYQPPVVGDNCGVCGDPLADPVPRPNEQGGIYGRGIIAANYTAGQIVPLRLEVTIPHNGSVHFQVCDEIPETDDCFFKRPYLDIYNLGGWTTEVQVGMEQMWINASLHIPSGLNCTQCVLRLNYRSGLLGDCDDQTVDYGCGLQQNFRTCTDVSIAP